MLVGGPIGVVCTALVEWVEADKHGQVVLACLRVGASACTSCAVKARWHVS